MMFRALALFVLPATALAGGPSLSISGPCPGTIDVEASGLTPGGDVAVLSGRGAGSDVVPGGPCAGALSDLSGLGLITVVSADGRGDIAVSPSVGGPTCGKHIQFLDLASCALSNTQVVGGADLPPECADYSWLEHDWRNVGATGPVYCDRDEIGLEQWYRFGGAAGEMMPEWAPDTYQCSTHAPGWLDGAHPRGMGDSDTIRTCWHWSSNTCLWENETPVTNCGDYYVYYLTTLPFACNGVYCGE